MTIRADLPGRIVALLTAPSNVALHGNPGSGKSWMGDQVVRLLQRSDHRCIQVDFSTARSGKDVFVEVLEDLEGTSADGASSTDASIRDIWKALRNQLMTSTQHVILILDQFDRVLHFADALDFLLLIRELVHRPASLRCTALMMSRRSLEAIETKVRGISTLAGVCYTQYLGSLYIDDLDGLTPGAENLDVSEKVDCLQWSGGHPALARYWLTTRPDKHPDPSGEMERAKIALRVLNNLAELRLIDAAAQYVLGPIVDDLLFERQELELLGVLTPRTEAADVIVSLSDEPYFRDALRHQTWNMNPWGVLGHAEVRLRGAVDLILSAAYGESWPIDVAKKSPAIDSARAAALEKQARDMRMFSRQAPWLSYTYPGDLWTIIQVEWQHFSEVFNSHDKAHWRRLVTGLAQYRAPLAHGRPEVLTDSQRAQCRLFAEDILAKLAQYDASRGESNQ